MGKALVLASWGYPEGWKTASYYGPTGLCGRRSELGYEGEGTATGSRTTLSRVVELLRDRGYETDAVIFVPDTVGVRYRGFGDVSSYEELVELVRKEVGRFVERHVGMGVQLEVVPGSGRFSALGGRRAYFDGFVDNAYVVMLGTAYGRAAAGSYDVVVADISHGVNYMPVFLRDAAWAVARYMSARLGREVCLVVLNSDPVQEEGDVARINVVEYAKVAESPPSFAQWVAGEVEHGGRLYMTLGAKPPQCVMEVDSAYRYTWAEVDLPGLVAALRYGAVLYLFYKSHILRKAAETLRELVNRTWRCIQERVEYRREESDTYVRRTYGFHPYHVYLAMAVDVLSQRLGNVEPGEIHLQALSQFPLEEPAATILSNEIDIVKARVVCLMDLNVMRPSVYVPLSDVLRPFEECCKRSGEDCGRDGEIGTCVSGQLAHCDLKCISQFSVGECRDDECHVNRRNFVAHAGLERNAVCVKAVERPGNGVDVYVKYRERCLAVIPNLLSMGSQQH